MIRGVFAEVGNIRGSERADARVWWCMLDEVVSGWQLLMMRILIYEFVDGDDDVFFAMFGLVGTRVYNSLDLMLISYCGLECN